MLPLKVIRIEQTQMRRMYVADIKVYKTLLKNELIFLIFFLNKKIPYFSEFIYHIYLISLDFLDGLIRGGTYTRNGGEG